MVNKSTFNDFKKQLLVIGLLSPAIVFGECSIEQKIASKSHEPINIEETRNYKTALVPIEEGLQSCFVTFDVLYANTWYPVYGEQEWDGNIMATTACNMAKQNALKGFIHKHGEQLITVHEDMTCADGEKVEHYKLKKIGAVMPIGKLKGDPKHRRPFIYNGASCWWVQDVEWSEQKLNSFNGIACQVEGDQFVLVDKF
ncbi:hypothetical protein N8Z09_04080 [Methylophilaceae bacterium]|nr:hypothetical protein [Methylophilaceae bacterium]